MKASLRTKSELLREISTLKRRIRKLEKSEFELMQERESFFSSKRILHDLVDHSSFLIYVKDLDGKFILVSQSLAAFFGHPRESLLGKTSHDFLPKEIADQHRANDLEVMQRQAVLHIEETADAPDGLHFFITMKYPLYNESNQLYAICGVSIDITDLKQAKDALQESEAFRQRIFESSKIPIVVMDADTLKYVDCNPAAVEIYRFSSREEMLGKTPLDVSAPLQYDNRPSSEKARFFIDKALAEGNVDFEWRHRRPDGEIWDAEVHLMSFQSDGRNFLQFTLQDITDRKRTEEHLLQWMRRYELIVAASGQVAYEYIVPTRRITWGSSIEKVLGYDVNEISGGFFQWQELLHPDDRRETLAALEAAEKACDYWDAEYRLMHKKGEYVWIRDRGFFLPDAQGKAYCQLGMLENINDRKQAEAALKESEKKYRLIADNTADMIEVMDMDLRVTYVSPSVTRIRGYTVEEVIGEPLDHGLTPDSVQRALSVFEQEMALEASGTADPHRIRSLEVEEYKKDGSTIWMEAGLSFLRDEKLNPVGILVASRDITDRKKAEKTLRLSEERFRGIASNLPGGVFQFFVRANGEMGLSYVSENARELLGLPNDPEQFFPQLTACVAPEERERFLGSINEAILSVRRWSFEGRYIKPTGEEMYLRGISAPIKVEDGLIFNGVILDVTDRRKAEVEKRKLEDRLHRAEKMEALGQLAGGVAHDLNNVLGVLSGYTELLLLEIPEEAKARKLAEKIQQSTEKGAVIIQDLLTLARRGVTATDVVNFNQIISGFLKSPVFEKMKDFHTQVTFRAECDPNLLNIKGSPIHLEKTLMNLVANAAEAISDAGEVVIRTENRYLDRSIEGHEEVKEGDYSVLMVSDTGTGIPEEQRDKIFEPFYTKKTMGRSGTGLGLPIVWGAVKDHKGYIDIQTKMGDGTTFTLYFPATREETGEPQQKIPIEQYQGAGESILVVDDIAEQRDVASGLLKKLGYRVHSVAGGEEAVEYLRENKADLLLLDMIMEPGMNGLETFRKILEIHPKQKAILVSGFSETDHVREAQKLGAGAYVKKPYVMETIGLVIRDELKR